MNWAKRHTGSKKKIFLASAIAAIIVISSMSGINCLGTNSKVFSANGLSITLPKSFAEKEDSNYSAIYQSQNTVVSVAREDDPSLAQAGALTNVSIIGFTEKLISMFQVDTMPTIGYGLIFFTYDKTISEKSFTYFATVFTGNNAYWLVQFSCETKDYDKLEQKFIGWAQTVSFS